MQANIQHYLNDKYSYYKTKRLPLSSLLLFPSLCGLGGTWGLVAFARTTVGSRRQPLDSQAPEAQMLHHVQRAVLPTQTGKKSPCPRL